MSAVNSNELLNSFPVSDQTDEEKGAMGSPAGNAAPDGGMTAWLVIAGVWCTTFCSFGWINSVGVFQTYYQDDLLKNFSASTVAWIPSLQIFFMSSMGPIVGALYDRYGPCQLMAVGTLLHVFGLMMASLGTEYYQLLLAQGVCSAIGVAAIFQPALNCVHGWFDRRRGAAFGIVTTGSSVGGVIFPILVSRTIKQVGFPWAMRICGFLILFLLIIANATIRPFHKPQPQPRTLTHYIKPLKELDFLFICIGFLLFTFGIYVPINYLQLQALDLGIDPNVALYMLPILNAASLFGRLFSGYTGDKLGRFNTFMIADVALVPTAIEETRIA